MRFRGVQGRVAAVIRNPTYTRSLAGSVFSVFLIHLLLNQEGRRVGRWYARATRLSSRRRSVIARGYIATRRPHSTLQFFGRYDLLIARTRRVARESRPTRPGRLMDSWSFAPPEEGTSMSGTKRVLIAHNDIPQVAVDLLKTKCNVTVLNSSWSTVDEVLKVIPDYDALLGKIHIDAKFLDAAGSRLKVISTPSAGYDHMDVAEIKKRGIKVGHSPKVLSAAVAETAVFLLLGAARRAHEGRVLLEKGEIKQGFQWLLGHDLRGKTVGIVGLGNIGEEIVKRLRPFEIKKFVYSGHSKKAAGDQLGAEFVSFNSLLEQSDFVICCTPLTPETQNMFNDTAFGKMKKTAVFVNIGRGKTVDTDALVRALKNNTIFAAGLDVTEPEPLPVDHELLKLPNAVIIPHMGSQTVETRNDMALAAAQNILNAFDGKPMLYGL